MAPLLATGEKAPDFALQGREGNVITLSEFQGKKNLVLVFYIENNTPD